MMQNNVEWNVFNNSIRILEQIESQRLRDDFISKFVDVNGEYFKMNILSQKQYVDGICYDGYLWDCLSECTVINENYIKILSNGFEKVFVMWDIHSCEKIGISDYWRFGKNSILSGRFHTFLEGEKYLPEDIYFFDETMTWCLIKTHEDYYGERYCLKCGSI